MISFLIRLITLALTLVVIVFAVGFGYAWYVGGQAMDRGEQAGWLSPAPDDAPLSVFETTVAKGIFGATWGETGIPCRTGARFGLHYLGQKDARAFSISQVMARDIAYETEANLSLDSQVRQLSLACMLENGHSDTALLRLWMRKANFGGVVGADEAAQGLFNKSPGELTAAESARLAALLSWPDSRGNASEWDARAKQLADTAAAN